MLLKHDINILLNLSLVLYTPFFDIDILNKLLLVSNKKRNNSFGFILLLFILCNENNETNKDKHFEI
jgi:hypothetical protein